MSVQPAVIVDGPMQRLFDHRIVPAACQRRLAVLLVWARAARVVRRLRLAAVDGVGPDTDRSPAIAHLQARLALAPGPTEAALAELERRGGRAALRLALLNQRLVREIAGEIWRRSGIATYGLDDAIQDGNQGLLEALRRYDPLRAASQWPCPEPDPERAAAVVIVGGDPVAPPAAGPDGPPPPALSTYAYHWISKVVRRNRHTYRPGLPLPEQVVAARVVAGRQGDLPGESVSRWVPAAIREIVSLDDLDPDRLGAALADRATPDPATVVIDRDRQRRVWDAIGTLPDPERRVIIRRFGLDGQAAASVPELVKALGYGRDRVRNLERRALARLRPQLALVADERGDPADG